MSARIYSLGVLNPAGSTWPSTKSLIVCGSEMFNGVMLLMATTEHHLHKLSMNDSLPPRQTPSPRPRAIFETWVARRESPHPCRVR